MSLTPGRKSSSYRSSSSYRQVLDRLRGQHRAGGDQRGVEALDLAGLVGRSGTMTVAHGVEQVRGQREPGGLVRKAWHEREAGLVGRAPRGVVEQVALTHVLGDGTETVEDGVVVAPFPPGLG